MKFPLFIYIKPPDDTILQRIVPTVWWESQHVADKEEEERNKKAYHASCAKLQQHVQDLEHLQVKITPCLDSIEMGHNYVMYT